MNKEKMGLFVLAILAIVLPTVISAENPGTNLVGE